MIGIEKKPTPTSQSCLLVVSCRDQYGACGFSSRQSNPSGAVFAVFKGDEGWFSCPLRSCSLPVMTSKDLTEHTDLDHPNTLDQGSFLEVNEGVECIKERPPTFFSELPSHRHKKKKRRRKSALAG